MAKIQFGDLVKFDFDDNKHCTGFNVYVDKYLFYFRRKEVQEHNDIWVMKSYDELHIPPIIVETNKHNEALTRIAEYGLYALANYLRDRQGLMSDLLNGINEHLVV